MPKRLNAVTQLLERQEAAGGTTGLQRPGISRPCMWTTVSARGPRARALLFLGRQSAIDLALDEWAAVAEASHAPHTIAHAPQMLTLGGFQEGPAARAAVERTAAATSATTARSIIAAFCGSSDLGVCESQQCIDSCF